MRRRKHLRSLCVMVTYACDLDCVYCEVNKHAWSSTPAMMRRAVDLLLTSESPLVKLQFFGGEPLLRFDLVREAVEYGSSKSREVGKSIVFMLTTNGRLLDAARLRWLRRYPVEIMFSLDGSAQTHAAFRPAKDGRDIHGLAVRNLSALQDLGIPYFLNATIDPANVDGALADVDFLVSLGARRLQVNYRIVAQWPPREAARLLELYETLCRRLPRGRPGPELMNLCSEMEPTILADQVFFDVDGQIYLELMVLTEKKWPALRQAMRLGRAEDGASLSSYLRTTAEIFEIYQRIYPSQTPEGRVLSNNIRLGLAVRKIMLRHGLREYAPVAAAALR